MSPMLFIRRDVFGVTQSEMARIAGVTQPTVSHWEKGSFEPNRDELGRIREEAAKRKIRWKDAWFFKAPSVSAANTGTAA